MTDKRIGIIGGSGLYDLDEMQLFQRIKVLTPFGEPSDQLVIGEVEGHGVVFLPRHGRGHRILPSEINYQANIWALKKMGVEWVIAVSAVGAYKKEILPLDIVLVDQFFDRTHHERGNTFFGNGIAAHISFAHPVCDKLRTTIYEAGQEEGAGSKIHWGGAYINIEGPAFSTKAESIIYKSWGLDVVGMTNVTEAKLAREAEMCYATIAMVTDYDCWNEEDPEQIVRVDVVLENFKKNIDLVKRIIFKSVARIPLERNCECASALKNAIVTQPGLVPQKTLDKLELIVGKYIKR